MSWLLFLFLFLFLFQSSLVYSTVLRGPHESQLVVLRIQIFHFVYTCCISRIPQQPPVHLGRTTLIPQVQGLGIRCYRQLARPRGDGSGSGGGGRESHSDRYVLYIPQYHCPYISYLCMQISKFHTFQMSLLVSAGEAIKYTWLVATQHQQATATGWPAPAIPRGRYCLIPKARVLLYITLHSRVQLLDRVVVVVVFVCSAIWYLNWYIYAKGEP